MSQEITVSNFGIQENQHNPSFPDDRLIETNSHAVKCKNEYFSGKNCFVDGNARIKARKTRDKLTKILKTYNISEEELYLKLGTVKRKTRKRRIKSVLSCKITNYLHKRKQKNYIRRKNKMRGMNRTLTVSLQEKLVNIGVNKNMQNKYNCKDNNENIKNGHFFENEIIRNCTDIRHSSEDCNDIVDNALVNKCDSNVNFNSNVVTSNCSVSSVINVLENMECATNDDNSVPANISDDSIQIIENDGKQDCFTTIDLCESEDVEISIPTPGTNKSRENAKENDSRTDILVEKLNHQKNVEIKQKDFDNVCTEEVSFIALNAENLSSSESIIDEQNVNEFQICDSSNSKDESLQFNSNTKIENDCDDECFEEFVTLQDNIQSVDIETYASDEDFCEIIDENNCYENASEFSGSEYCSGGSQTSLTIGPLFPDFKTDDDIRSKIKEQLELLRTNKKPTKDMCHSSKTNDSIDFSEDKLCEDSNDNVTMVHPSLNDVLLSNDGDHLIVSVVGGYISDEENTSSENIENLLKRSEKSTDDMPMPEEKYEKEIENESAVIKCSKNIYNRDTSMADILLKRDYDMKCENEKNSDGKPYFIKPTKTNDITKIKGWRTKNFSTSETNENSADECLKPENEDDITAEHLPKSSDDSKNEIQKYINLSLPSTSKGFAVQNNGTITETKNPLEDSVSSVSNTKSAFVSDVLDTFLNNHAELKISYEVPKLVAEEAISKPEGELPLKSAYADDLLVTNNVKTNKTIKNDSSVKPKTLAEKRKLLELERQSKLVHTMESNESTYIKQLEKHDKKSGTVRNIRNQLIKEVTPFSKHCWDLATKNDRECVRYAVVNGKKIRIAGSFGGSDIMIKSASKVLLTSNLAKKTWDDAKSAESDLKKNKEKKNQNTSNVRDLYKPGPLSKKHKLVKSNCENCEYEVLKMPKIKLILYPQLGKQIPLLAEKYLQLYKNEQEFISDEWAKFAVSAVVCKDKQKECKVEFDIPYANHQNKILLRKITRKNSVKNSDLKSKQNLSTYNEIEQIVSEMVTTIENQTLDEIIIQNDPDLEELSQEVEKSDYRPISPVGPMVQAIIKRRNNKRSRTTLELRRLNVQVIEVDVEAEEMKNDSNLVCTKDYCQLGCVCKSLMGLGGTYSDHCGLEACMFKCTCVLSSAQHNKHHSVTLPAGTDLLSASTMVRLQDEAVKHLAKEEKKFTQTVIKANNQTIVMGGGVRDRQKRVPKLPKKFTDYVNTTEELVNLQTTNEETTNDIKITKKLVPIWKNTPESKNAEKKIETNRLCRIQVEKLDMKNVLPWCMVHNLYKCYCRGTTEVVEDNVVTTKSVETDNNDYITYAPRYGTRHISSRISDLHKNCARTRSLHTNYYQVRNRSQAFKTRYAEIRKEQETMQVDLQKYLSPSPVKITEATNENKRKLDDNDTDVIVKKRARKQVFPTDLTVKTTNTENNTIAVPNITDNSTDAAVTELKKPQIINLVDTEMHENKKVVTHEDSIKERMKIASLIDYEKSYMGLLVPTQDWVQRFQKMLNLTNIKVHHIRLLQWTCLLERYRNGTLQFWLNSKRNYNNVILTENKKRPSRVHVNIKLFEKTNIEHFKVPVIVSNLLRNKLPSNATNPSETYVILVNCGLDWEARGSIVLHNTGELYKVKLAHKPMPGLILSPPIVTRHKISFKSILKEFGNVSSNDSNKLGMMYSGRINDSTTNNTASTSTSEEYRNKDQPPKPVSLLYKGLEISKVISPVDNEYKAKTINSLPTKSSTEKQSSSIDKSSNNIVNDNSSKNIGVLCENTTRNILASLPVGKDKNRWFMLKLENDFSVLKITSTNFHIKYTHLTTALHMAEKKKQTVRIRSHDKAKTKNHDSSFGIYALPEWNDRIFFGPYGESEDHGLETFRYVNRKLVNTKTYNIMRGNTEERVTGVWFTHNSIHNTFNLEPQYSQNDGSLQHSRNEYNVETLSLEKAAKPQIEFVDLTENDSGDENNSSREVQNTLDPLYNVLAADFSRHLTDDITIERISEDGKKTTISNENKSEFIIKQNINKELSNAKKVSINELSTRKEQSLKQFKKCIPLVDQVKQASPKNGQMEIEIIHLDDENPDSSEQRDTNLTSEQDSNKTIDFNCFNQNIKEKTEKKKQIPQLYPINAFKNVDQKKKTIEATNMTSLLKSMYNILYVVSDVPALGYIEVLLCDDLYYVPVLQDPSKSPKKFKDLHTALTWMEIILKQKIFHLPISLDLGLKVWKSSEVPNIPKFEEKFLNGYHMVCDKGIYDFFALSTNEIDNLGFTVKETTDILSYKCKVLIKKNIQILGYNLLGTDSHKLEDSKILDMAPQKIKSLEAKESAYVEMKKTLVKAQKEMLSQINSLLSEVPNITRKHVKRNVENILCKNYKNVTNVEDDKPTSSTISPPFIPNIANVVPSSSQNTPGSISTSGKTYVKIVDGNKIMVDKSLLPKKQNLKIMPVKMDSLTPVSVDKVVSLKVKNPSIIHPSQFKLANGSQFIPVSRPNILCRNLKTVNVKTKLTNTLDQSTTIVDLTDS